MIHFNNFVYVDNSYILNFNWDFDVIEEKGSFDNELFDVYGVFYVKS